MKTKQLILTVVATDKPGIVRQVSDLVHSHNGNWLESSLSRLGGQFVGIIQVIINEADVEPLLIALAGLTSQDIEVTPHLLPTENELCASSDATIMDVQVEANDRQGIIEEITTALLAHKINVEKMSSRCESASMAGYMLFQADIRVVLPEAMSASQVQTILEDMSDDLMVTVL